ncbi:MFS transporter [Salirhabdus salicampi]|uniref:MFS transporter n=1 Tax=Salirhabdus salicampi TaxID=476102 RepID=UPI00266BF24A|nr:MFS transporter [Salirhabdus salicampi]
MNYILSVAKFMIIPFLAILFKNDLHLSATEVGFLLGLTPLSSLCFSFIGGRLSDVYGVRKFYIISLFVSSVVMLLYGLTTSYFLLCLISVLSGIGWSIFNSTNQSLITLFSPKDFVNKSFNINYWVFNLGGVTGPLIGAKIATVESIRVPLYIFSFTLFVLAVLSMITLSQNEKKKVEKRESNLISKTVFQKVFTDKMLLGLISSFFLLFFIESQMDTNIVQYIDASFEEGIMLYAQLLTMSMLMVIILQPFAAVFTDKVPRNILLLFGGAMYFIGPILFWSTTSQYTWFVAFALLTVGEIILAPTIQASVAKLPDDGYKTTYFSFVNMGGSLAFFVGPWFGGLLYDYINIIYLFILMSLAGIIMSFILLSISKVKNEMVHESEQAYL